LQSKRLACFCHISFILIPNFLRFIAGNDNRFHAAALRFSHMSVDEAISEWQVSCSSRSHLEFVLTTTSLLFCIFMQNLQPRARESISFAPNECDKCNEKFTFWRCFKMNVTLCFSRKCALTCKHRHRLVVGVGTATYSEK